MNTINIIEDSPQLIRLDIRINGNKSSKCVPKQLRCQVRWFRTTLVQVAKYAKYQEKTNHVHK